MAEHSQNESLFNALRESIEQRLVDRVIPSLAVAVARGGQILWEEGFGWADREERRAATAHTVYSLASITKPITATGLMLLKQRGRIDLDKPVNEYLGEAKLTARMGDAGEATVRRVAGHTAGLPMHYQFFYADEPYQPPRMDETIRRYGNLITAPGERFEYSNLGYGVLDYVITRISDKPYADFVREELFLPLGMTHAAIGLPPALAQHAATRYAPDGMPFPFYDFDHPGGSAAFCSAHDLARFGMFHLKAHLRDQKAILSDESIDEMKINPTLGEKPVGYGFGWGIQEDNFGYRTVGHNGGMSGVSTTLILVPDEGIVVVALANSPTSLPHDVGIDILSILLPPFAERRAAWLAEQEAKKGEPGSSAPDFNMPDALRGTWSGTVHTYEGDLPLTLWCKDSGDIHAQLGDQLKTLVNEPAMTDGFLTGKLMGDIGTADARRTRQRLELELKPRGDVLNGGVFSMTPHEHADGAAPGKRVDNALCHWTELKKQA